VLLSDDSDGGGAAQSPLSALTPQETQIALIVGNGASNKEAAVTLFVSTKTIEFHLGNIYRKLGLRSRSGLASVLARAGGLRHYQVVE
jgi:DNA-binding CsgD family transcriptional regulator